MPHLWQKLVRQNLQWCRKRRRALNFFSQTLHRVGSAQHLSWGGEREGEEDRDDDLDAAAA